MFWIIPVVIAIMFYRVQRNKRIIKSIADSNMGSVIWKEDRKKTLWKEILLACSLTFLIISLARPRWGRILTITEAEGYNVVFALDASSSMLAQDVKGGRIDKAKESIKASLGQLPGSRFGLVAFSGKAYKLCPLTTDVNAFRLFVDLVEPALIPTEGTDIGAAIRKSTELFSEKLSGSRIIIIVTDGENTRGDPRVEALNARKEGVKIFTISAGTKEGAPIPRFDSTGKFSEYLKDENGKPHISIVNHDMLNLIAKSGNGVFLEGEGVELGILVKLFKGLKTGKFSSERVEHYQEKYIFFLLPSLLFLVIASLVRTGKE